MNRESQNNKSSINNKKGKINLIIDEKNIDNGEFKNI
jgi:hypothetical protein